MTAPATALATALAGTISGPSTIRVGPHTIERRKLGSWRDGTDALVAAYWAVVGSAVAS